MRKSIAIIVDNAARDLSASILLASELAKHYHVSLVPMSQASTDIFRIQPDLVILNFLRETNKALVKRLIRCGIKYSVLDTEGAVFMSLPGSKDTSYTKTIPQDGFIRSKVEQFFVWGTALFEDLVERNIYPREAMQLCGSPRMDFYHSSFRSYFLKNQKDIRPNILFNTSFAVNNPRFSSREGEIEMLVSKFGYEREFILKLVSQLDEVQNTYIFLARFLAEQLPEVEIIFRPHPFEKPSVYEDSFKDIPNIRIKSDGSVSELIHKTSSIVHFECSTAVEGAFAGKPAFSLEKFKNVRPVPIVQAVTEYVTDEKDLLERVKLCLSGNYQNPEAISAQVKKVEEAYFYRVDGQAFKRIASLVSSDLDKKDTKKTLIHTFWAQLYFIGMLGRSLIKRIVKGHLVPEGKKMKPEELSHICKNLGLMRDLQVDWKRIPLSSSFSIFIKN
jgi:surface carbohydrate biosynthesis protein